MNSNYEKNISVLEDDDSLRELFTVLLEDEGYEGSTYATVRGFTQSLNNKLPNLFIIDVRLPDGDGMQACVTEKKDMLATFTFDNVTGQMYFINDRGGSHQQLIKLDIISRLKIRNSFFWGVASGK